MLLIFSIIDDKHTLKEGVEGLELENSSLETDVALDVLDARMEVLMSTLSEFPDKSVVLNQCEDVKIALDALSEKVFGYSDSFDVDYLHGLLANLVENLNFLE